MNQAVMAGCKEYGGSSGLL